LSPLEKEPHGFMRLASHGRRDRPCPSLGLTDQVSLVAMGDNGIKRTDEDELCAIHLRNRLEGRLGDGDATRRLILAGGEVARFHDPARPYLHPEDVDIALDIDRYDFAVRVDFEDGRPVARMEKPA
jgi:2-phosphosulfolactate phosphatase